MHYSLALTLVIGLPALAAPAAQTAAASRGSGATATTPSRPSLSGLPDFSSLLGGAGASGASGTCGFPDLSGLLASLPDLSSLASRLGSAGISGASGTSGLPDLSGLLGRLGGAGASGASSPSISGASKPSISAAPAGVLKERQVVGSNANDINGPCKDVMLIFARGTLESGNMGNIIGGSFATNLKNGMRGKSVGVQGVDYSADIGGYLLGGDQSGARKMADMTNKLAQRCPNTKIVLSGYSQGGQVTHDAWGQVSSSAKQHVGAIVIFGDPDNGTPFRGIASDKVKIFCDSGDLICAHLPLPIGSHLTYGEVAGQAADFVKSKVQ